MTWSAVRVQPSDNAESRDAIVAALFASGAQAIVEEGSAIVTHFPSTADLDLICSAVHAADASASITAAAVADEDWSVAWRSHVTAHQVGALTIAPPWLADSFDPASTIIIEPGMAFGTGDHASTRGVLRLLPTSLRAGDVVADLGSGSAVLSIAAAKLGARRVYAIELDGEALSNAQANVQANAVSDRVHVVQGDAFALLPLVAPVELVLGNIVSGVLESLLPQMETSLTSGGRAILSGLLVSEREVFAALLIARGWRILDDCSEGDWWTVAIARN